MWLYLFAILLAIGFHYLMEYFSRNPEFLTKPIEEQRKLKWKIRLSVYGGLALGCMLAWLMQNGFTAWMRHLPLVVYVAIYVGGFYLCWLAYVIGIRRDSSVLKKTDGKLFNKPEKLLAKFALLNLAAGIGILIVGIAIPILKIDFQRWGGLLILVLACRKLLWTHFERSDENSES